MEPVAINQKVLILNQNYQPIMVIGGKRAIILMYLEKVDVLEHYSDYVHSQSLSLQIPSVIKLKKYTRYLRNNITLSRKSIFLRDNHTCQYCGKKHLPLTVDHVVPKDKGGKDIWENLTTACLICNNWKGNKTPREGGMMLLSIPKKPSFVFYFQQFVKSKQHSWRPYLFMDPVKYD